MIGRVHFHAWNELAVATLGDDGRWTVDIPRKSGDPDWDRAAETIASGLNVDLDLSRYSPADGQRGYRQMHEAAERLGGTVEAPEVGPGVPGTAY